MSGCQHTSHCFGREQSDLVVAKDILLTYVVMSSKNIQYLSSDFGGTSTAMFPQLQTHLLSTSSRLVAVQSQLRNSNLATPLILKWHERITSYDVSKHLKGEAARKEASLILTLAA